MPSDLQPQQHLHHHILAKTGLYLGTKCPALPSPHSRPRWSQSTPPPCAAHLQCSGLTALVCHCLSLPVQEARHKGSNAGLGRSPGEGHGNPLQNPKDRGAWQATVRGVVQSQTPLKHSTTTPARGPQGPCMFTPFSTLQQGCTPLQWSEALGLGLPSHPQLTLIQEMAGLYFEQRHVTPPWARTSPPLPKNHTPSVLSQ